MPVQLEFIVARIGNQELIIAILVLNAIITLVLLFFMIRTGFWKALPRFSYLDIGSVIVVSVDGRGIRRDVCTATEISAVQDIWTGTQADGRVG